MRKNPVFGWGHDLYGGFLGPANMESVLGRTVALRKSPSALEIDVEFLPESVNPKAQMALEMIRAKTLNAVSIGFIPRRVVIEMEDQREIPVIVQSELLEISLVPIPSNPDALATNRTIDRSLNFDCVARRLALLANN